MLFTSLIVASCLSTALQAMALPTPVDTEVTATKDVDTATPDLFPFGYVDKTKRTEEQELDEDADATPDMFPFGYVDKKAKRVIAAPQNTDFPFGYVDRRFKREAVAPEATSQPEVGPAKPFPFGYTDKKAKRID